jgi:ubiquitin-associated SH3 domain-containing protein
LSLAGGNILIVGHAGSLDSCLRQLCGKTPRNSAKFHEILSQFPYCCLAMATEDVASKRWMLKEPPVPSINHRANKDFSWKVLQ